MFLLPSHSSSRIEDPLSLLDYDSEDGLVPFWDFLHAVLEPLLQRDSQDISLISSFKEVLENISYSRGLGGSPDLSILLSFATESQSAPALLSPWLIQSIAKFALRMKELFSDGTLSSLQFTGHEDVAVSASIRISSQTLSHQQITCLICHMVLGTLSPPPWPLSWNGPNLGPVWFDSSTAGNDRIKRDYVTVLLSYLQEELRILPDTPHSQVDYRIVDTAQDDATLYSTQEGYDPEFSEMLKGPKVIPMIPLQIIVLDEEDDDDKVCFSGTENGSTFCQLVSANKEVGFGPTGTQEERIFASTSVLLPIVLFAPPLSPTQALLVSGHTEIFGHFKGHLRTARLSDDDGNNLVKGIYTPSQRRMQARTGRIFLFLDALEMDGEERGKDLDPQNVYRELRKLACGFNALGSYADADDDRAPRTGDGKKVVVISPWGCGAFGGDFHIKLLLIWICASAYGDNVEELRLAVRRDWWESLDQDWRALIDHFREMSLERVWVAFSHLMRKYVDDPNSAIQWHSLRPPL